MREESEFGNRSLKLSIEAEINYVLNVVHCWS